ncbi:MAG: hypothetical protein ACRD1K_10680, partial [Acidimicrobiales bacterium]
AVSLELLAQPAQRVDLVRDFHRISSVRLVGLAEVDAVVVANRDAQALRPSPSLLVHHVPGRHSIARSLNDRPRKRLEFMKPSERLAELLAMTG